MLNGVGRLLVRVAVLAALVVATAMLPKAKVAGETVACTSPVPVRDTVCGLLLAPSVMVKAPVRVPVAVGVNTTLMEQLAPAASEVPQVFVCE
jgi:hypothetical protein